MDAKLTQPLNAFTLKLLIETTISNIDNLSYRELADTAFRLSYSKTRKEYDKETLELINNAYQLLVKEIGRRVYESIPDEVDA